MIIRSIPSYCKVAFSSLFFRFLTISCKLITIPLLLKYLHEEEYVALVILGSLEGWFLLFDLGVGASLQNYLSESRAKNLSDKDLLLTGFLLAVLSSFLGFFLIWGALPLVSQFFLGRVLSYPKAQSIFFLSATFLLFSTFGSVASKVLISRQRGYIVYFLQGIASVCSLAFLVGWTHFDKVSLPVASFAVFGIPGCISLCTAFFVFSQLDWKQKFRVDVLLRAKNFFLFSLMASFVTLSDTLIVPRVLKVEELIEYNVLCKIFGVVSFTYGAFVQGLFPECSEAFASGAFDRIKRRIYKGSLYGVAGVVIFTLFLWFFSPFLEKIFTVPVHPFPLFFFGFYLCIRVFSDFHAMALQSYSRLGSFFYLTPIQAILSIVLQYALASYFGIVGILMGLSLSYLLTVFWALPRQLRAIS